MPTASSRLLLSCVLLLAGCDDLLGDAKPRPKPAPEAPPEPVPDLGSASAPPEPLVRAEHRLRFGGKSGERMGFALAKLSRMHALAGAIEVPEWSQPGTGSPRLTRDDDYRTSWTCDPDGEHACAIGIHFPEPAEVEVVRMYAATPEDGSAHARPDLVRVNTTQGWAEARFSDDDRPWHMLLAEPIATRNLSVEILETHGQGPVHLAEIEVFGRTGVPRPPLKVELHRRVVTLQSPPWRSKAHTHTAQPSFIEQVDVDGRLQRLFPGTAMFGRQGDRMVLIENAAWSSCDDDQGTYDLFDLETRVVVPLGDFGGFGAQVFRQGDGTGMALGTLDFDDGSVQAVVVDHDSYEHRISNRLDRRSPEELLAAWAIDPTPLSRSDAQTMQAPPEGCGAAATAELEALRAHLPHRTKVVPEQWLACSLGGGIRALISTSGACGREWHVAVLDDEGGLSGLRSAKETNTYLRMRRLDGETLLLELWGSKDSPLLLRVDLDGPHEIAATAGFSLRPPQACRKRCSDEFANDRAAGESATGPS